MTDATERARALLAEALGANDPDTPPLTRELMDLSAGTAVETLVANPSLLVDLALEAGGLEHVGTLAGQTFWPVDPTLPGADPMDRVYRRKEKP